jgi:hypothetical protein
MPRHSPRPPHKPESYSRRTGFREENERLLIACEGDNEKLYLRLVIHEFKLTATVIIEAAGGGNPGNVVNKAIDYRNKASDKGSPFDKVWCVFDTEKVADKNQFFQAVTKAKNEQINLAITNPCLEYWFILHFESTTQAFSDCNDVIRKAKTIGQLADYDKSKEILKRIILKHLIPNTETAINNAMTCLKQVKQTNSDEFPSPSTTINTLLGVLSELKRAKPYNS